MCPRVTAVSRLCFYQICVSCVSFNDLLRLLVQAFIHCRLDYRNSLLAGTADTQIKRLQSVHNTILVFVARRRPHHSSPTQPPLASRAAKDYFQVEMHPRRRIFLLLIERAIRW